MIRLVTSYSKCSRTKLKVLNFKKFHLNTFLDSQTGYQTSDLLGRVLDLIRKCAAEYNELLILRIPNLWPQEECLR